LWRQKMVTKNIVRHTGDNRISDYVNAKSAGLEAEHITNVDYTHIETVVERVNGDMAGIVRAVRLSMQAAGAGLFYYLFPNVMLPLAIIICLYIHDRVTRKQIETVIFLSRDGYWLHEVYKIMYPSAPCMYKYFSRLLLKNPDSADAFVNEINGIPGSKLLVDLQGSGKTINTVLDRLEAAYYMLAVATGTAYMSKPNTFYMTDVSGRLNDVGRDVYIHYIEDIFTAPHGSIGGAREVLAAEYDISILKPYMEGLNIFKTYMGWYKDYAGAGSGSADCIKALDEILFQADPSISSIYKLVQHITSHEEKYNGFALTYYSQENQDKFYIERVAKFKCNGVFVDIGAGDGIKNNNTYFLEKNLNWSGLVVEYNPVLAESLRAHRHVAVCSKVIYGGTEKKVDVVVAAAGVGNQMPNYYELSTRLSVETINVNEMFQMYNLTIIDYLSVRGARGRVSARDELDIFNEIDFSRVSIKFICVTHGGSNLEYEMRIMKLLKSKGYVVATRHSWGDTYYLT